MTNYQEDEDKNQQYSPLNLNKKNWREGNQSQLPANEIEKDSNPIEKKNIEIFEKENNFIQKWRESPEFKIGLEKLLTEANQSNKENPKDENESKEELNKYKKSFIYFPEDLVKQYKSQYPYFYSYIKNDFKKYLLGSNKIKAALLKYSVGALTPDKIEETASFNTKTGPAIEITNFSNPNQNGEYYYKGNTIKLSHTLIQQYEEIMSDKKASKNKKLAISISLNQVLINEFTHYGDALDGIDAIQSPNGNIVNNPTPGQGSEGGMLSQFDEGNEAVAEIFEFYGTDETTGLQNLILHTKGIYLDPSSKTPVGKDLSKIDSSLIPPIPSLEKNARQ